jgi:hypothetical protein
MTAENADTPTPHSPRHSGTREFSRGPGIHTPGGGYGFRARSLCSRPGMTAEWFDAPARDHPRLLSRQILKQPSALSRLQIRHRDLAARCARGLDRAAGLPASRQSNVPPSLTRGRAERRTLSASAASCAVKTSTRVSHHGHAELVRRSARDGFHGLLRGLPGERSLDGSPLQLGRWLSSPKR